LLAGAVIGFGVDAEAVVWLVPILARYLGVLATT